MLETRDMILIRKFRRVLRGGDVENCLRDGGKIEINIRDKESSSDLETGAEPRRLELEEEFGEFLQEIPLYPLLSRVRHLCRKSARRHRAKGEEFFLLR